MLYRRSLARRSAGYQPLQEGITEAGAPGPTITSCFEEAQRIHATGARAELTTTHQQLGGAHVAVVVLSQDQRYTTSGGIDRRIDSPVVSMEHVEGAE